MKFRTTKTTARIVATKNWITIKTIIRKQKRAANQSTRFFVLIVSDLSGAGVFCAKTAEKSGFLRDFQSFFGINVDCVVNLLYNMHINIK